MDTMELADTIERLTRERAAAQKMADAWERVGIDARVALCRARADLDAERASATARALEHSRAVVAGIAGAMGLDTSGEGDAIHARILAEHARLTRERDAARAALRDASRCDECGAWATRYHHASASYGCDECGVGEGWADDSHAAALRAARSP